MMIWANEPVGKYEGQKINKVAKYHQNAGKQKLRLWAQNSNYCATAVDGDKKQMKIDNLCAWLLVCLVI